MSTTSQAWTIGRVLEWTRKDFAERGVASPRLDAEVLVAHALGVPRIELYTRHDQPLGAPELAVIRASVERRRAMEPVAYIVGQREFYGRVFAVDRRVLVPRPETEGVVGAVLESLPPRVDGETVRVLDVGTGSGAIAITVALERPDAVVDAVDRSPDALSVAKENAVRHECTARVNFFEGSVYDPIGGERYHVIASNPPYIRTSELGSLPVDVREHEPALALDGGAAGDLVLAPLISRAREHLLSSGALVIELSHDQAAHARQLASDAGFESVRIEKDLAGIERVLIAR